MKKFPHAALLFLTTTLLVACDGGGTGPTPATFDLTVRLQGVNSAPLKVTNTTSNTVIFNGTLDSTKVFTGIAANSVLTVEGQAMNGYEKPDSQTVTLESSKSVTVTYKAVALTRTLTVNLNGVSSAPLKITNTTTGTVIVDGSVTSGQQFTGLQDGSVLRIEPQQVSGMATPASQTVTLNGNLTVSVTYGPTSTVFRSLTVNVGGSTSAPVTIVDTSNQTTLFSGAINGSTTLTNVPENSVVTITPQAVDGLTTPPTQTVTVSGNTTTSLRYLPQNAVTHTLNVTVTGVPSAPVKITDAKTNDVLFQGSLSGSNAFPGLMDGSQAVIQPGVVTDYQTPAAQTLTLNADQQATLIYLPVPSLDASKFQGTLTDWPFSAAVVKTSTDYFNAPDLLNQSGAISAAGTISGTLGTPALLQPFFPRLSPVGACSFTGASTATNFNTASPQVLGVYSSGGDYLGRLNETTTAGEAVYRFYSDITAELSGTCDNGALIQLKVQRGWNAYVVKAATPPVLTNLPAGVTTRFTFHQATPGLNIVLPSLGQLTLRDGESVTQEATFYQTGGLSGTVTLETSVPSISLSPATITLPSLNAQTLSTQGLTALSLKQGLTFTAAFGSEPFMGSMDIIARKNGQEVGRTAVSVYLWPRYVQPGLISSEAVTLAQGETQDVKLRLSSIGYSGATTVTLGNLPAGVTASTETVNFTDGQTQDVIIKVTAAPEATMTSIQATITGSRIRNYSAQPSTVTLNVTPGRTLLGENIVATAPAPGGIWALIMPTYSSYALLLVQEGKVTNQFSVPGSMTGMTHLLSTPTGDAVVTSEVVNADWSTKSVVQRYGVSGRTSTCEASGGQDAQRHARGAVDGSGNLWFARDTTMQTGGSTSAVLAKLDLNTCNTTVVSGPQLVGHETLHISADGSKIVFPAFSDSYKLNSVNTLTGTTDVLTSTQSLSGGVVSNSGDYYFVPSAGDSLVKVSPTSTTVTPLGGLYSSQTIGFDHAASQTLWLVKDKALAKLDTVTGEFVNVAPLPAVWGVEYRFSTTSLPTGVGVVSSENYLNTSGNYNTRYYVSVVK